MACVDMADGKYQVYVGGKLVAEYANPHEALRDAIERSLASEGPVTYRQEFTIKCSAEDHKHPEPAPKPEPVPDPAPTPTPAPKPEPGGDHDHPTIVGEKEITVGHDKIPRFAANPDCVAISSGAWSDSKIWQGGRRPIGGLKVSIPAGRTVTYDVADGAVDALEIAGSLHFDNRSDTKLSADTVTVLPGGVLAIAPSPSRAEIVFLDGPLRAGDEQQLSRGLLVLGELYIEGRSLSNTFVRLAGGATARSSKVELAEPVDWPVGAEILFPDTRQTNPVSHPRYYKYKPEWEVRKILAISKDGREITLNAPLDFAHLGARNMDGTPALGFDKEPITPHVACLSRSVVIRSAKPGGVRGHAQAFGPAAIKVRFAEFRDLGRTKAAPIEPITNRAGRYSFHLHHVEGPRGGVVPGAQFLVEGCSFSGNLKWGLVLHGSHYGVARGNVVYDTDGAGIAGEDGSEAGNIVEGNFVCRVNGQAGYPPLFNGLGEATEDAGDQGDGFWFAGPLSRLSYNVAVNCYRSGFTIWPDGVPTHPDTRTIRPVKVPSGPGGKKKTVNLLEAALRHFEGNEVYGATTSGLQLWSVGDRRQFPSKDPADVNTISDFLFWNVSGVGIRFYYADSYLVDGLIGRGDPEKAGVGIEGGGPDYPSRGELATHAGSVARWSSLRKADLGGGNFGYINRGRGLSDYAELVDAVIDSPQGIEIVAFGQAESPDGSSDGVYKNVRFLDSYSPGSLRAIRMYWETPSEADVLAKETHTVINYQGIEGLNLDLYYHEQAPGSKVKGLPAGKAPKGRWAPSKERDGDSGVLAHWRGCAMGIDGLVFVTGHPPKPLLFWNVLPDSGGAPVLFWTVTGLAPGAPDPEVRISWGGNTKKVKLATGAIEIGGLGSGTHTIKVDSDATTPKSREVLIPPRPFIR